MPLCFILCALIVPSDLLRGDLKHVPFCIIDPGGLKKKSLFVHTDVLFEMIFFSFLAEIAFLQPAVAHLCYMRTGPLQAGLVLPGEVLEVLTKETINLNPV